MATKAELECLRSADLRRCRRCRRCRSQLVGAPLAAGIVHELGLESTGELVRTLGGPLTGQLVRAFGARLTADIVAALEPVFTGERSPTAVFGPVLTQVQYTACCCLLSTISVRCSALPGR